MKIYKLCAALAIAAICSITLAQTPAAQPADRPTREQVLKLFEVMHLQRQMEQLMNLMTVQMKQQLRTALQKQSPGLSAEDEAKLETHASDAMTIYPVSEMMDDMIPIYQRHMTKSDVDAIIAFYGSPAGQHLLTESPVMMKESMTTIMPKVNARTQAYIAKVTKDAQAPIPTGGQSPAPAASTTPSTAPAPPK